MKPERQPQVTRPRGTATPTKQAPGSVQSITRALSILDALAASDGGLTLALLSKRVSLPPSSTHRLLTTLQRQRFVRFDPSSKSWHVGVQAFVVGSAFAQSCDVVALAKPYMRRVMETTGETVNLYVLNGGEAVCMAQVQCPQMIGAISRPGGGLRLHRSASGKAMMSSMQNEAIAEIVSRHGMARSTYNTIVSMKNLQSELAAIRTRGFAVDNEEFTLGLRCVAAPILDERSLACAALSVAGPVERMTDERLAELGGIVTTAVRWATAELRRGIL